MPVSPRSTDKPSRPVRRRPSSPSSGTARAAGRARGPGRGQASRPSRSTTSRPRTVAAPQPTAPKPRLTGRAAILVLVLAVLAVSYASSLRAYLQQRAQIQSLQSTISEREAQIDDLEVEKSRWLDPEYVETQARARLGYVMPGETPFVALRDGQPIASDAELTDPDSLPQSVPPAFWNDAWDTMLLAGNPPKRADPPPLTRIGDPNDTPSDTPSDNGEGDE